MTVDDPTTDALTDAAIAFATTIREGRGIDPVEEMKLRTALRAFGESRRDSSSVPKGVASVLVELFPALYGSAGIYDAVTGQRIEKVATELTDEVLAALA